MFSGGFHPGAHRRGGFPRSHVAQLLVCHLKHLHVDINPVHQRTQDALLVARRGGR